MARSPLLAPRWIVGHVFVVIAVVTFVALGMWQLDRWGEEKALADQLEERLASDPVALSTVTDRPVEDIEHLPVSTSGQYLTDEEVLLRSRSDNGRSGYHVVTPLQLDDGRAVLVNRGWVPFELDDPPITEAAPPSQVTIDGVVIGSTENPSGGLGPTDPAEGELERMFHADVDRIAQQTDVELLPFLIQLTAQTPAQSGDLPVPADLPSADPTQNLSYAGQWFSFAVIAVVGYALGMRHLVRKREDDDGSPSGGVPRGVESVAP
ncbi:MAG: SURF1 family protein [Nitriliruptorales bacterium]|nr:SURF1 family protein [Nitriliruptorales bacterium]